MAVQPKQCVCVCVHYEGLWEVWPQSCRFIPCMRGGHAVTVIQFSMHTAISLTYPFTNMSRINIAHVKKEGIFAHISIKNCAIIFISDLK